MKVDTFVTGPFQENCYLVVDERSGDAVIVDPGEDGEDLIAAVRAANVTLRAIWLTHAHVDHVGAVAALKRVWAVPIYLHAAELPLYRNATRQATKYGLTIEQPPEPDRFFEAGMSLAVGGLEFSVLHAPGHAPGHVVIHGEGIALVGDCLFAGSVGRTDLPFSNTAELARSLAVITALPPDTRVLPGHGPPTTIGEERRSNPFLRGIAAGEAR